METLYTSFKFQLKEPLQMSCINIGFAFASLTALHLPAHTECIHCRKQ